MSGVRTLAGAATIVLRLCVSFVCLAAFALGCGHSYRSVKLPADLASRFDAQRAWRDLERVVSFGRGRRGRRRWRTRQSMFWDQLHAAVVAGRGTGVHHQYAARADHVSEHSSPARGPVVRRGLIVGGHYDTKWMPRMRFMGRQRRRFQHGGAAGNRARAGRPAGGRMARVVRRRGVRGEIRREGRFLRQHASRAKVV